MHNSTSVAVREPLRHLANDVRGLSLAQRAALLGEFGRATREFGGRFGLVTLERRVGGRGIGSSLGQLLVRGA